MTQCPGQWATGAAASRRAEAEAGIFSGRRAPTT
jgi:hypothetical protein